MKSLLPSLQQRARRARWAVSNLLRACVPEETIYRFRLSQAQAEKRRVEEMYSREIAAARSAGDDHKAEELWGDKIREEIDAEEKIYVLQTQRLLQLAEDYFLPRPPFTGAQTDAWRRSDAFGRWHLTDEAMVSLRAAIREERTARMEELKSWVTLGIQVATAAIGVIGALIGYAAVK